MTPDRTEYAKGIACIERAIPFADMWDYRPVVSMVTGSVLCMW